MIDFQTWLETTNSSLGTKLESKELAEFISQNTMSFEGLELAYEREDDFFKFYEKQNATPFVVYSRNKQSEIDILGVFAIREMLIEGKKTPYLYTSDFRVDKKKVNPRNLVAFRKVYKSIISESKSIKEFSHLDHIYTCILAGNESAIKIFTKGKGGIFYHFVKNYYSYICPVLPAFNKKATPHLPVTIDELLSFYKNNEDGYISEILLDKVKQNYAQDPRRFVVIKRLGKITAAAYFDKSYGRKLVLYKKNFLIKFALLFINLFRKNKIVHTVPMIYLKLLRLSKNEKNREEEIKKLISKARNQKLLLPGDLILYSSSEKLKRNSFLDIEIEGNLYKVSADENESGLPIGPDQKIFLEFSEL